ncbi:serine hydrolase domain-containing protein [Acetanaerobacterium elongatum]|uniref:CubicO group peptidase, beta-lactamase class C family n=1 Tax=Acetanaerobacterium elongatum TaxID=258515 RepID=A0A1H0C7C0_9FIRM|nr:serine hydrolase [Acetanaerobacterium elongatum]SDN53731.1 CubicO group peptidase, beta-lactamase class C family [Acetanaerobacterium elongatum]
MNEAIFEGFIKSNAQNNLNVYGIHVYSKTLGSAAHHFRAQERVHLFSGSKAFTSMAVGIAAGEGRLGLSDKIIDYFPQYRDIAAPGAEQITVKDLLQMRVGHDKSLFTTLEESHEHKLDWAELFFHTPMAHEAGTAYLYDNGSSYMLSRVVEAVSGQNLREYLMPRFFAPLDIFNPQWHTCPGGHSLGAFGLFLNTEEFSRLGILLLNNGRWQDKQIVPEKYLRLAINDTVTTAGFDDIENKQGYGYQLWRCTVKDAYRADGKYGQYSIVLPDRQAVVTVTAHNEVLANDILRAVWSEILPSL